LPIHPRDELLLKEVVKPLRVAVAQICLLQFCKNPPFNRVTPTMEAGLIDCVWTLKEWLSKIRDYIEKYSIQSPAFERAGLS
jgi:hypothetical protein